MTTKFTGLVVRGSELLENDHLSFEDPDDACDSQFTVLEAGEDGATGLIRCRVIMGRTWRNVPPHTIYVDPNARFKVWRFAEPVEPSVPPFDGYEFYDSVARKWKRFGDQKHLREIHPRLNREVMMIRRAES